MKKRKPQLFRFLLVRKVNSLNIVHYIFIDLTDSYPVRNFASTKIFLWQDFAKELEAECRAKSTLPREFAKLLLNGVSTDVFNKLK